MKSYKKPIPPLPSLPIEGDPVTLQSMSAVAKHISRNLRMADRSLGRMTMDQMFAFHKGLLTLFQTIEAMKEDPVKPKKPRSRDYEPKDDNDDHDDRKKPPSKKWTPEMIFMDILQEHLLEEYQEDSYEDIHDMTLEEIGLKSEDVFQVIAKSVSGTKIKRPAFAWNDTSTVKDLFETLKAAKVFRGRKGPIRDPDDHDD